MVIRDPYRAVVVPPVDVRMTNVFIERQELPFRQMSAPPGGAGPRVAVRFKPRPPD
jgi:hypothetical protein